jgi:hypothetical protein
MPSSRLRGTGPSRRTPPVRLRVLAGRRRVERVLIANDELQPRPGRQAALSAAALSPARDRCRAVVHAQCDLHQTRVVGDGEPQLEGMTTKPSRCVET